MEQNLYAVGAPYYDMSYASKSDLNDMPFYLNLARRAGGPVLEIACGTGRILLEMAKLGLEVCGLDFSEAMLTIFRGKLEGCTPEVRSRVTLQQGDMRTFALGRSFKLVTLPFRPMQHMYTIEDQIAALSRAHEHMQPEGRLALDVFFPDFRKLDEPLGQEICELEWNDPQDPSVRARRYFRRLKNNRLEQWFEGEFIFRFSRDERLLREERMPLRMGFYTYPHMQLLFKQCGLEIVEEYGSFQREPMDVCKEMIFVLRKQ